MEQKDFDFAAQAQVEAKARLRRALSVSALSDRIRGVVETEFTDVWVVGEISNLRPNNSGHLYFSLKDERAQVRAVVWKSDVRYLRFRPKDGMKVFARGRVCVYAPKGEYQLQVQVLEPIGKGALQQAFEELKARLEREGLFDAARKRPLPMLPRRIGIVTSPTGAAIQDILRVLSGRYRNLEILLYPARVQGAEAAAEIVQGIRAFNRVARLDALIVARGGGTLEDLWPFNEEAVARALAASEVPTISAVGHETDFTISDFVADLRAPTPSAAAERVVRAKEDLHARVTALEQRLSAGMRLRYTRVRARVLAVTSHRVFAAERGRLRAMRERVGALLHRCGSGARRQLERARAGYQRRGERLSVFRLDRQLVERRARLSRGQERLERLLFGSLEARKAALARHAGRLSSLSPLGVLARGYALVWDADGRRLLRDAAATEPGRGVRIRLQRGSLTATVTSVEAGERE